LVRFVTLLCGIQHSRAAIEVREATSTAPKGGFGVAGRIAKHLWNQEMENMSVSWKTGAALCILALAGGVGCAAGGEPASDGETLMAPEADEGNVPAGPSGAPGDVDVNVNVNEIGSNDTGHSCWHHHHHHHGGGAQGWPGEGDQPPPGPAAPSPPPAPPPLANPPVPPR
jgi:hypothetical protein